MNEKVYKAIKKTDTNRYLLFVPREVLGNGKVIGDHGWIQVDGSSSYSPADSSSRLYDWDKQDFEVVDADLIESEWYRLCEAAGKLVEKPKEVIMYPIY